MSIHKAINRDKGICSVTFTLTDTLVDHPREATLVGDFNNWDSKSGKMYKSESGFFEETILLPLGKAYQFRYLINQRNWENDWQADDYVPSPFGEEENMVINCNLNDEIS